MPEEKRKVLCPECDTETEATECPKCKFDLEGFFHFRRWNKANVKLDEAERSAKQKEDETKKAIERASKRSKGHFWPHGSGQ